MKSIAGWLWVPILLFAASGLGQDAKAGASPVGRWKTVDDASGKATSVVAIWEENGRLFGKVEKLLNPVDPHPRCVSCAGEKKDRPVIGMRILWGLQRVGDEWAGGKVLDPNNGKEYDCHIAVVDGGKKLKVRGFLGLSLLGRTQYWFRD